MPGKVLDSFALIAYFRDEPGAELMETLLVIAGKKDSPLHMTDVNYAEVKYSIVKKDGAAAWEEAAKILQGFARQVGVGELLILDAFLDVLIVKVELADGVIGAV